MRGGRLVRCGPSGHTCWPDARFAGVPCGAPLPFRYHGSQGAVPAKGRKMATLANIAVIIFEILGLRISIASRGWKIFAFYTQVSNLITLASSVAFLVAGPAVAPLRYLSSCMLTMTFLVTLFVLVPMGGGFNQLMLLGNGLYHHTLCPLVSVTSYVLWEAHGGSWLAPVVVTTVYGVTMLYLNYRRVFDGPYPFFRVHNQSVTASVVWTLVLIVAIAVISLGMSWIAR